MGTTCIEVSQIKVNDAYKADPGIIKPALGILSKVDGLISAFQGLDLENPENLYFLQAWKDIKYHHDFQADESIYSKLLSEVARFTSGYQLFHVEFTENPFEGFSSPLTELTSWKLAEGVDASAFTMRLKSFIMDISRWHAQSGAFGQAVEDRHLFVMIIGWDSLKAMQSALRDPLIEQPISELSGLAVLERRAFQLESFKS